MMLLHLVKENVKKIKEDPSKCQTDVELMEKKALLNSSVCHNSSVWVTLFFKWKLLTVTQACFLCPTPI